MEASARSVMIGSSLAWWLVWIPREYDGYGPERLRRPQTTQGYMLTQMGPPHEHCVIVATNIAGQLPAMEARSARYMPTEAYADSAADFDRSGGNPGGL